LKRVFLENKQNRLFEIFEIFFEVKNRMPFKTKSRVKKAKVIKINK
jgi:hypothetical protein